MTDPADPNAPADPSAAPAAPAPAAPAPAAPAPAAAAPAYPMPPYAPPAGYPPQPMYPAPYPQPAMPTVVAPGIAVYASAPPAYPPAPYAPSPYAPSPYAPAPYAPAAPYPPAPAAAAPAAAAPAAALTTMPSGAVVGRWSQYRFAEESVSDHAQVQVLAGPPLPSDLPSITAIDPGLEALNAAVERQLARVPIAAIDYAPGRATEWFLFSPFELFMEQVLAKKLGTLE